MICLWLSKSIPRYTFTHCVNFKKADIRFRFPVFGFLPWKNYMNFFCWFLPLLPQWRYLMIYFGVSESKQAWQFCMYKNTGHTVGFVDQLIDMPAANRCRFFSKEAYSRLIAGTVPLQPFFFLVYQIPSEDIR